MLSRDWQCLNGRCCAQFHSYEHANPPCPHCGCVRVRWIPGGGHISNAKGIDTTLRSLATSYGMGDINSPSPSRLNRAMPKHDPVVADGPVKTFAPGFSAPFNTQGRSTCEPSRERINFTVTAAAERHLAQQGNLPMIGASNWKGMRRQYRP